jgi:hypothetical protein
MPVVTHCDKLHLFKGYVTEFGKVSLMDFRAIELLLSFKIMTVFHKKRGPGIWRNKRFGNLLFHMYRRRCNGLFDSSRVMNHNIPPVFATHHSSIYPLLRNSPRM